MLDFEIPAVLPVTSLSVSSINTYLKCPAKWMRKYMLRETEPVGPGLIIGSAVGSACNVNDSLKTESGKDLLLNEVLDVFSDEFDLKVQESGDRDGIDWGTSSAATAKDEGVGVLSVYHQTITPTFQPVSVEREFVLSPGDVDWVFKGYMDVETADGRIIDRKVKAKAMSATDPLVDLQATSYLLARREEARAGFGDPAVGFDFHVMKKLKKPAVDIVSAPRTDAQLDAFYRRLLGIASEIAWRAEHDNWGGAVPGSWWCSPKFCGFFDSCPMGGQA